MAVVKSLVKKRFLSDSPEETEKIGQQIGKTLPDGSVVCFFGDLAAGKTTFIKGLAKGVAKVDPDQVDSPTFVYLNIYEGTRPIYHFDLYRLEGFKDFLDMGLDEYFGAPGVCCIEWSEKIQNFLPPHFIRVVMRHTGEKQREITIIS